MANTTCLDCGQPLASYVVGRYGRCDACFDRLSALLAAFEIPDGTLVAVTYAPGFAADLTSWETCFFEDGSIRQSIRWYKPVHGSDREPERTGSLSDLQFSELNQWLAAIDLAKLNAYRRCLTVDDMPSVHLYSPSHNLHVGVTLWSAGDDKLSEDAREGRDQFQQAWRWIDSLSPYSILEHHRQRR